MIRVAQQCLDGARLFEYFCKRDCFYFQAGTGSGCDGDGEVNGIRSRKRRKIFVTDKSGNSTQNPKTSSDNSCLLEFSKVICLLRALIANERELMTAPPPVLSFTGDGNNM